jgi:micrococcal nuclease
MNRIFQKIKPALFITILALFIFNASLSLAADSYQVSRVVDGDTIHLRAANSSSDIIIRLVGIDAPEVSHKKHEPSQPFGQAATKHLAGLVLNKTVTIQPYGQDRYGRTLAVVLLSGTSINLEMVKAGLAEVYRGTPAPRFDNGPYQKAEREAQATGRGMWVQGDKYVSPREWRRMNTN